MAKVPDAEAEVVVMVTKTAVPGREFPGGPLFALAGSSGCVALRGLGSSLQPPARDLRECFDDDASGHFRPSVHALDERDRHFGDRQPLAFDPPGELDLEDIPGRTERVEFYRLESRAAERPEPRRDVLQVRA